jgi:hypothetical protein
MKAIVLSTKSSIHRPSLRRVFHFIPLVLVCFGLAPMAQAVGPDTDGSIPGSNNGEGIGVLISRTTGVWNSGTGFEALNHLTAGNQNTATGLRALNSDINGGYNTGTGVYSLFSNTSGFFNSATGAYSLSSNISGNNNTATGYGALYRNTADNNTATGFGALFRNTTGTSNTAVGTEALNHNVDGFQNTVVGAGAGPNLVTAAGNSNTYLGQFVGSTIPEETNTIRIADISIDGFGSAECFIGGIFNNFQPVGGAVVEVTLDLADDHLGWDVGPIQGGSAPAPRGAPQPRSRQQLPAARPQHQAMLNDKVEKLQATVAQQQKQIETLTAQLREQAAQIQKVSAQLEVTKAAPQTVSNK